MITEEENVKRTMVLVKNILDKFEVAGVVVLHSPEYTEAMVKIEAPFSCARHEEGRVKIRAKLEDFKGDKKVRSKKLNDTSNMLHQLTDKTITAIYPYFEVCEQLDQKISEDQT